MKIAYICSNVLPISKETKKGTEIFNKILLTQLAKLNDTNLDITVFASGDADVPFPLISVNDIASRKNPVIQPEKHIMFELALLSKAYSMQDTFDLYHINIGNGDIALPFAPFVKKPMLITTHYTLEDPYVKLYFHLFSDFPNVYFVTASHTQKNMMQHQQRLKVIYHGIEEEIFSFNEAGGEAILWAGRSIPEKGLPMVLEVAKKTGEKLTACVIRIPGQENWLTETLANASENTSENQLTILYDIVREDMITYFQKSKLFLFPIQWEEPFGLVLAEAMACGTPVVAFARGAIPEVVVDGITGFLVNPSYTDIRGNFIVQKTGIDGLVEAVERTYALSENEYKTMRNACRNRVKNHFSAEIMAKEYSKTYKNLLTRNSL